MKGTFVVLQARINSTRLPGKLLLPLKGISILEHILMRLVCAEIPEGVIVATTRETVPHIDNILSRYRVHLFVGSEEDVLGRFWGAVQQFGATTAVRATADNPLVCIEYLDRACKLHDNRGADLTTFPLLPHGTGVEVIRGSTIKMLNMQVTDPFEREHITQHIYRNESHFVIERGIPEESLRRPDLRLTVDTQDDYRRMSAIYNDLYGGSPIRLGDVITHLDSRS